MASSPLSDANLSLRATSLALKQSAPRSAPLNPTVRAAKTRRRPAASRDRRREEQWQCRISNRSSWVESSRYVVTKNWNLKSAHFCHLVRHRTEDLPVHPARPEQCRVDQVRPAMSQRVGISNLGLLVQLFLLELTWRLLQRRKHVLRRRRRRHAPTPPRRPTG